jgi:hypothetical protein
LLRSSGEARDKWQRQPYHASRQGSSRLQDHLNLEATLMLGSLALELGTNGTALYGFFMPERRVLTPGLCDTRYIATRLGAPSGLLLSDEPRREIFMGLAFLAPAIALLALTLGLMRLRDKLIGCRS